MANKEKAEIMIENTTKEIQHYDKLITKVRGQLDTIAKSYVWIAGEIKEINDKKAWELYEGQEGYKESYSGIGEFCADVFGISKSLTSKLLTIGNFAFDEKYRIKEEWRDYTMSALYAIAQLPAKTRKENVLSPDMTLAQIEDLKGGEKPGRKRKESKVEISGDEIKAVEASAEEESQYVDDPVFDEAEELKNLAKDFCYIAGDVIYNSNKLGLVEEDISALYKLQEKLGKLC